MNTGKKLDDDIKKIKRQMERASELAASRRKARDPKAKIEDKLDYIAALLEMLVRR